MGRGPDKIIILSDGIRGHLHQSRGVANCLHQLAGGAVSVHEVPRLKGVHRFRMLKIGGRFLPRGKESDLLSWLEETGGRSLLQEVRKEIGETSPEKVLFLSAGSSAAPFCLSLARLMGARCAAIMTPAVLGTEPFDFAIVPEHDHPDPAPNLLVTLGAPNHIVPQFLQSHAGELEQRYPANSERRWALLLGGDDGNYRISPEWIRCWVPPLLEQAAREKADLYITTSRRTSPAAEEVLRGVAEGEECVRMLLLASKDPSNPVPGMLGLCDKILCTDDSVSMVSEAVTAGRDVALLRVERKRGLRSSLNRLTESLVAAGLLKPEILSGPPRFDRFFARLAEKGYLTEFETPKQLGPFLQRRDTAGDRPLFDEARRAAEWLMERWNS